MRSAIYEKGSWKVTIAEDIGGGASVRTEARSTSKPLPVHLAGLSAHDHPSFDLACFSVKAVLRHLSPSCPLYESGDIPKPKSFSGEYSKFFHVCVQEECEIAESQGLAAIYSVDGMPCVVLFEEKDDASDFANELSSLDYRERSVLALQVPNGNTVRFEGAEGGEDIYLISDLEPEAVLGPIWSPAPSF